MTVFKLHNTKTLVTGIMIRQLVNVLFIVHVLYLVVFNRWFLNNILVAESIALLLLFIRMLHKKERNVSAINFDDENKVCKVEYYIFLFIPRRRVLQYDKIFFRYGRSIYLKQVTTYSLQILTNNNWFLFEIRQKYNIGWTDQEIMAIKDFVQNNKLINFDAQAEARLFK